jgi:peptidyl-prolyl cis-trans isomerase A (cyclophilin A)
MSRIEINTELGLIKLNLRPDASPTTCQYIKKCVQQGLYNGTTFYRSDFVIQCGLHGSSNKENPNGDLKVNETNSNIKITNKRGTAAIAHFDVPDNGNTEFFINIKNNSHLDNVYGGYCVFAQVDDKDKASWATIEAIADAIANQEKPTIRIDTVKIAGVPPNFLGIGTF